jgi:UDP-glucose 4-epimerase
VKILFTGGAGFIGSNVVDALVEGGHEVTVVDNLSTGKEENLNTDVKFYNIDLLDPESLELVFREFKPEIIYHHAAQIDVRKSVEEPSFDAETNVVGSVNLFELCIRYGVKRIIFSSTGGALYGEVDNLPADENTVVKPLSPYGVSKYCIEHYLDYYKRIYEIESVILRYANVYGPRQDPLGEAGVIAIFMGRILNGQKPVIYGDGTQTRDYIFVEDIVRANLIALNGKEGIYNIGTGKETSVNELISIFSNITNHDVEPIYTDSRKGEVQRISIDGSKASKELGFTPIFSVVDGLKKTIEWYGKNK